MDERKLFDLLAEVREPAVLATVVATKGSTPRKAGAKMLLERDGVIAGTIGGGCGEGEVIAAAQDLFDGGPPTTVRIDLTDDLTSWSPAVCGGIMDVFIERADGHRGDDHRTDGRRDHEHRADRGGSVSTREGSPRRRP